MIEHKKLTQWKNEPTITDLRHDLQSALPYYSHHISNIRRWLEVLNVQNDNERRKKGKSGISVKVVRKLYEWRYSTLASPFLLEKNLFKVSPAGKDDLYSAVQNQLVLNSQFNRKINKTKFINDLVRTLVNEGTAIIRTGWDYKAGEYIRYQPVYKYRKPSEDERLTIETEIGKYLQDFGITPDMMQQSLTDQISNDPNHQEIINSSPQLQQNPILGNIANPPSQYSPEEMEKYTKINQMDEQGNQQGIEDQVNSDILDEQFNQFQEMNQPQVDPVMLGEMQQQQQPSQEEMFGQLAEQMKEFNEFLKSKGRDPIFKELDDEILNASIEESLKRGNIVVAEKTNKTKKIKEDRVVCNQPKVEIVNNYDIIFDPTCNGNVKNAKFVIYKFETCFADLKANQEVYKFVDDLLDIDGINRREAFSLSDEQFITLSREDNFNFKFKDLARQKFYAYEYWGFYDIDGNGLLQPIVATFVDDVIIRLEISPFSDNELPFTVIQYMPQKNCVYGQPDAELIEDNQSIITTLTRSVIDVTAKTATAQTALPKNFLDATNKIRFYNGENYEYNQITGMHPNQAVYTHPIQELPQSVFMFLNQQIEDVESATGIKSYAHGIDQTAYGQNVGARFSLANLSQRESDILFRISDGLAEVGRKVCSMNAKWLDETETVEITRNEFISVPKKSLDGNYYIDVDISSTTENFTQAQNLSFLLQTLGNTVDFEVTRPLLVKLARLYHMDDVALSIQEYAPQPDPHLQQMQELELQLKQQEIAKLQADTKAQLSEAEYFNTRSKYILSLTDNEDLKYLRSGEGIDHEEKKDLAETQAKANALAQVARSRDPDVDPMDQRKAAKKIVDDFDRDFGRRENPRTFKSPPPQQQEQQEVPEENSVNIGNSYGKVDAIPRPRIPTADGEPQPLNNVNRKLGLT